MGAQCALAWIGLNHVHHLCEKVTILHAFERAEKFWQGEEDIKAGTVVWETTCRAVLSYGSEVLACPSQDSGRKLEQVQDRAWWVLLGYCGDFKG